jgi:RNA polymerase sigma-70 factor (ECF subfamily)
MTMDSPTEIFQGQRPRLFSIAYRMLGTRADADDVLQDAWLRWQSADHAALQSAQAWLVTVVTRLAIDRLRAVKAEREHYPGWWLPEPIVEPLDERTPESVAELAGDVSLAFLHLLERLSPDERAAFLLRQVFDHDYDEIAAMLGKSEAACRQMVHRAAERLRQQRPRTTVPRPVHEALLRKFMVAARSGQREAVKALLAEDVTAIGDGGGKVPSIAKLLQGPDRIANLYWAVHRRLGDAVRYELADVNGEPGLLRYVDGRIESVHCFVVDGAQIVAIYSVRNPDKLARIPGLASGLRAL